MFTQIMRALIWMTSAAAAILFTLVVIQRLAHPAAPSPLEGALLDYAQRVIEHRPLYVEPASPAPPPLMPGYPVLLSLLDRVFGVRLDVLRVLSVLATVLAAVAVAAIVRAETLSSTFSVASAGLVLAGCALIAGQPDLARPEMLMLVLVLSGYAALRFTSGALGAMLGALLLTTACTIHPFAVWFTVGALCFVGIDDRRRLLVMLVALAVLAGGGFVALSFYLGPWFNFFAVDLPLHSLHFEPTTLLQFLGSQMLGQLGVLAVGAVLTFALPAPPWRGNRGLWMFMGIAMLASGLAATQGGGADPALLVPGVVVLALLGPMSLERLTRYLAAWPGSNRVEGQGVALVALALQFIILATAVPAALATLW
jgi:hypothetical protein